MSQQYQKINKIKTFRTSKITRQKVPNLINLPQTWKQYNHAKPKFFYIIKNSLRLLQQPVHQQQSKQHQIAKTQYLNPLRYKISNRLKTLSQHKQRSVVSVNDTYHSKSLYSIQTPQLFKQHLNRKTLPNIRQLPSKHAPSQNQSNSSYTRYNSQKLNIQIVSATMNEKSYQQILAQKQKQQIILQSNISHPSQSNTSIYQQSISQEKKQSVHQKQQEEDGWNDNNHLEQFKIITAKIIAGQSKLYQTYDRKLMEKCQLYRTKKFKFNHEYTWK